MNNHEENLKENLKECTNGKKKKYITMKQLESPL